LQQRLLLFDNKGDSSLSWEKAKEPALIRWWNGYSAEMDFTNPGAVKWYQDQLKDLQTKYGVDGFKLDAGDMEYYPANSVPFKKATPNEQCEAWGQFGLLFPLNEYRAMWKRGGAPLVERLRDKAHTWEDLQKLIPNLTVAGLLGYPFACPDMIGGGEFGSFIGKENLDEDLVVRSAQCSALMPMMQFSAAPWRVLDSSHFKAVMKTVNLRMKMEPYIMQLTKEAAISGEPIARTMEYVFPHQGLDTCKDQFMLGDKFMVAPVVEKNAKRQVVFPSGRWKADDGSMIKGPSIKTFIVPIDRLLWFERMSQ
jgi:alpha-glucosidase